MPAKNAPIQGEHADEVTIQMVQAIQAGVSFKYSEKGGQSVKERTRELYKLYTEAMDKLTDDQKEVVRNLLKEQFKTHK